MKVGIYNQPSGSFGGSEYLVTVLAHALSERHQVEIVHHNPTLTRAQLAELSGLDLGRVGLRFVRREERPDPRSPSGLRHLGRRYRAELGWHADLSRPYNLFINSTHDLPPFCHAPMGVLLSLFPSEDRMKMWPWAADANRKAPIFKRSLQHACCDWLWQKRFDSYQHKLSTSEYTRKWTKARWGIDSDILYPPVDTCFKPAPKSNLVLSVGRFATYSHSKRQLEMMAAYREMKDAPLRGWCCFSVGGLSDRPEDLAYFDQVGRIASECGAHVIPNIRRAELRELFEKAKIFWHAAGYGSDESTSPFEAEHFGISIVEAMAAGGVPIVYDRGGPSEIVEHGRNGYLWRTLDELRDYTRRLAEDEGLREQMAAAAQRRAEGFTREAFVNNFTRLLGLELAAVRES